MQRVFVALSGFWADWTGSGLGESELTSLEDTLLSNPRSGDMVRETGGIRKIRFARPGGGKSSGVRVFYLDVPAKEKLYLLALLRKNEKENLSRAERNELAALAKILKEEIDEPVQKTQGRTRRSDRARKKT